MASSSKTIKWALGISLVFNVFLLSAGVAFWGYKHFRPHPPTPVSALSEATKGLSPETSQRIITKVADAALKAEPDMKAAWELREQAADAAKLPSYDREKILGLLTQARELEIRGKIAIETVLIDEAANLSPEERTIVADRFIKSSFKLRRLIYKARKAEEEKAKKDAAVTAKP